MRLLIIEVFYLFLIYSPEGSDNFIAPEYACITPLRILLLKDSDPDAWKRLQLLMDHEEDRRKETKYQEMFQVPIVTKFSDYF